MNRNHRRSFLKQVGGLAAVAAAAPPLADPAMASAPQSPRSAPGGASDANRAYASSRFAIDLDGVFGGWLSAVEGGSATADVVVEKIGPDNIQRKHLGNVKYEDISLECGAAMSKNFYEWISQSFNYKHARRNGAIVTTDANLREVSRLSFYDALLTEIGFPACDAASKDAAKMTVKLSTEYTRLTFGPGERLPAAGPRQKRWLTSNFKFTIEDMDAPRVTSIESLVVRQVVSEGTVGENRDYSKEPYLEVPNLVVTFPESHASDFYKWHEDFVIKGNNGQEQEKSGSLDFLSPDLKESLFTLSFGHLGIFKLGDDGTGDGSGQQRRLKAEMYCEEIKFDSHIG